jgi:hypothetical protein
MVRAINLTSDSEFLDAVSRYLDPKQFLKHIAVEAYLAEFDGVLGEPSGMNNFHVYRFAGSTTYTFIPWDKDLTFISIERPIFAQVEQNVLARRLMNIPEYRNLFMQYVADAANIMGGPGGFLEQMVGNLYNYIVDAAKRDPFKQCVIDGEVRTCGPGDFENGVEYLREFARLRTEFVMKDLIENGYSASSSSESGSSPRLTAGRIGRQQMR